ncbi:hypothetical protein [Microvirga sp. M2]|uniref:hypothetical protein n=1 Tax=Microvirga sp. M2 TaxID=3073270 RepID=UPI0039C10D28
MHSVTRTQGGRPDGTAPPFADRPAGADGPKRATRILRDLVQGAWRRRLLILLPVLLMMPVGIAAAFVLPKAYMARSLMQLQEAGRDNPFSREGDAGGVYRVQERFEGLRALFLSDSVLARAIGEGEDGLPPAVREERIGELRQALSLDLIGGDFIEVKLAGATPEGLGKTLEAVMASFLEALVPEQGGATAAQLMVSARRQELDALLRAKEAAQRELAGLLPGGSEDAAHQLAAIEADRRDKGDLLNRTETEIARRRSALGNPSDEQLEKDIAALPADGTAQDAPPAGTGRQDDERIQNLLALRSLLSLRQSLASQTQGLGSNASALSERMTRSRELQERIATLDKVIAVARETYENYRNRFSGTNAVRSVGILKAPELIRIVDPPRDPSSASRSRFVYVLSGITAGGLIGLGLAFVAERLDQRIRHADEASEATGLPVLAVVPDRDERIGRGDGRAGQPRRSSAAAG